MKTWTRKHWLALLQQRCPRCHAGKVFQAPMRMNKACPVCGMVFEREAGYFLGAMYVSYGLSSAVLILGLLVIHMVLPQLDLGWGVLLAAVLYLPFVPLAFRYSRVIWIYWDRWMWPMAKDVHEQRLESGN